MEYRELGQTGLKVSRIGFGGAPIGIANYLSAEDRESPEFRARAIAALQAAAAGGVTYFDTAQGYGDGRSEGLLGEALADSRSHVILATKFLFQEGKSAGDYTRDLQQSLRRLRTDYVDVLQVHGNVWDDAAAAKLQASRALDWAEAMREKGLIRFVGITAEGPSGALEGLLRSGRFSVLEIAYSVIYQATCDYQRAPAGIIPLAKSLGIGVTVMRPTTCGVLQKLFRSSFPEIDSRRVTELAINFALSTPEVDCVVVGMRSPEEVHTNI
ncbi:MAG TPA: aldo/keto reductase, partial [Capsulimonadaceae bacterium]|nr:aldo/keto reductase [Capsulimonadaceae bacterium]